MVTDSYPLSLVFKMPPLDDDAFDEYIVREGFIEIEKVEVMELFLLRAATRLHSLDSERFALSNKDEDLPHLKLKAWAWLRQQFEPSSSNDLFVFFTETDDYAEATSETRKRLRVVASMLTGSSRDLSRVTQAQALIAQSKMMG